MIKARIAEIRHEAEAIRSFVLVSEDGSSLPAVSPGAHIDVCVSPGIVRQYSLCNGPADKNCYLIAVKRHADSRGGSSGMCEGTAVDQIITIGAPRNSFPLAPEATAHLLIAAGIGITPLISMFKHLRHRDIRHHLRYYGRSTREMAFAAMLGSADYSSSSSLRAGLTREDIVADLTRALSVRSAGEHVYICGPAAFMSRVQALAIAAGWAESHVHMEYFEPLSAATNRNTEFTVHLARCGRTIVVPARQSIVDALRAAGLQIETSCELGICGTCLTNVVEGSPDHRDEFLTDDERASGALMLPCVSRALGAHLVLDL